MTMGKDLVKKTDADLAILKGLKTKVKRTRTQVPTGQIDFLRMLKSGRWVYGQNNMRVQEGSLWAINPLSFKSGYVCWTDYPDDAKKKNKMLNKIMLPLGSELPDESDLKQFFDDADEYNNGQPWPYNPNMSVEMTCVSGEDKGKTVLYETSSKGGLGLLGADGYLDKMENMVDEGTPVAIIRLVNDEYDHPTWGETLTPDFEYVEWRSLSDDTAVETTDEEEEDEAPKRTRSRSSKPAKQIEKDEAEDVEAEDEDEEDEAPRRRRDEPEDAEEPPKRRRSRPAGDEDEDAGEAPEPTRRRRRPAA
jgi:hypothetical protein